MLVALLGCGSEVEDSASSEAPSGEEGPAETAVAEDPADESGRDAKVPEAGEAASVPDLEPLHGEYGPPDDPDTSRTWWVTTEPCEERGLRVGAMWGDASPWDLAPESDTAFSGTGFGGTVIRAEFGPEGETPRTLRLEFGDQTRELVRFGDLPEGFQTQCGRG